MSNESEYLDLAEHVLNCGEPRASRAGPTRAIFGCDLELHMNLFPILTTREIFWKPVLGELAAFLEGTSDVRRFEALGCNYWRPNAEAWAPGKNSVGRIYGVQWRHWAGTDGPVDQLIDLVDGLRDTPHGRRHILATWNPGELHDMCLPPCHLLAQFYVRENYLDCLVYMRSVDVCLGLPSDMVLYGMLLELVAAEIGRTAGRLRFSLGDVHIYENHMEALKEQLTRELSLFPTTILNQSGNHLFNFRADKVAMIEYNPAPAIKYVLNV